MKTLFNLFKTIRHSNHVQTKEEAAERQEYLDRSQVEAKNIFDSLLPEVKKEIKTSGNAFIHVVGKYDNIFIYRTSLLVRKMFEKEDLKLQDGYM